MGSGRSTSLGTAVPSPTRMAGQALRAEKLARGTEGDSSNSPYVPTDPNSTTPTDPTKLAKYKTSSEQAYRV